MVIVKNKLVSKPILVFSIDYLKKKGSPHWAEIFVNEKKKASVFPWENCENSNIFNFFKIFFGFKEESKIISRITFKIIWDGSTSVSNSEEEIIWRKKTLDPFNSLPLYLTVLSMSMSYPLLKIFYQSHKI